MVFTDWPQGIDTPWQRRVLFQPRKISTRVWSLLGGSDGSVCLDTVLSHGLVVNDANFGEPPKTRLEKESKIEILFM